jgi:hypothetical protein
VLLSQTAEAPGLAGTSDETEASTIALMVNSKRRKYRGNKEKYIPQQETKQEAQSRFQSSISKSWKIAVGAITVTATILGLATGYLSLVSRVGVSPATSLDLRDPFSTPFVLSNDGQVGINNIDFTCKLLSVKTKTLVFDNLDFSSSSQISAMEPGEKSSVTCAFRRAFEMSEPVVSADIVISATFRPDYVPWSVKRELRFVAARDVTDILHWFPQPYSRTKSSKK